MTNLEEFFTKNKNDGIEPRVSQREYLPDSVKDRHIESLTADKITAGTITVALGVGSANIIIDGENTRIVINDGTHDRILIGYQADGF